MDDALLESLLHRSESETLDFKEVPLPEPTRSEKSELLKDILAFANAWRDSEAHILIGVRESRHGKSIVTDHLDDHSLQQFVCAKTNRRVPFSYSAFPVGGTQIGVLTFPVTDQKPFS